MSASSTDGGAARARSPWLVPALVVAVMAISFAAVLFRATPELHPLTAAGWRLVIAGLTLSPLWRWLPRSARGAATLGGLAYALHFGAWVASLGLVSVLVSTTVVTTTPLVLALLALVTGRDRPGRRALIGLALGVGGVALLAWSHDATHATSSEGVTLALLGAAAMAVYLLVARRVRLSSWRESLAFSGVAALVGGLVLLACAAVVGAPLGPTTLAEAAVVVGAAALPQLVGHSILTWALGETTPTVVALATLGEPIGAALLAALLLGEPLTGLGLAACTLTLAAVALALTERTAGSARRPARPPAGTTERG